ncbi:carboxypeptidase regulatory-like domain-containing protein [Nonlabens ponticola]|uniref:Fibronectin type-III domain-containing protein n=1 Tax=Nonlabens ponticola TaxID=2496866 RepID=A0A3S9MY69_9FLAO|nr:carboxypeptidase regulatory-like domain-containing protein [Nonlabens ponticola]AZQ44079.1 hypothetical protein EJ995_07485 [Nonlabens ponticola]
MRAKIIFIVSILVLAISCTEDTVEVNGKGTVTGRVVADESFEPLANVKISTNPNTSTTFTDADGQFSLEIENGTYAVKAEKDGFLVDFESADVETDEETTLVFELKVSTANNQPPSAPELIFPEDEAVEIPFNFTLEWESLDVDQDSLTYTVTLRNASDNSVRTFEDIEEDELEVTVEYGTTYFWQVTVNDGINDPVNSSLNSFTTQSIPANRFLYVRKDDDNNVIYSADRDGNEIALTDESRNSWRPRVNKQVGRIAFLRSVGSNTQLFTMNLNGNDVRQVSSSVPVRGFNLDEIDIAWANNGSAIYYPSQNRLYRINTNGSGLTQVYQTVNGNLISEVDYNNGVIALKTNDLDGYNVEIFTINESGTRLNTVLTGIDGAAGGLDLSIDNTRLLYSRDVSGFESSDYRRLDSRVFIHQFNNQSNTEISFNKPGGTNDLDPRFSPTDAQVIVTNRDNDDTGVGTIDILELGQVDPRNNTFENAFMPDWE